VNLLNNLYCGGIVFCCMFTGYFFATDNNAVWIACILAVISYFLLGLNIEDKEK